MPPLFDATDVLVIIPVRNEVTTITGVIEQLHALGLRRVRVVDNGSSDNSAQVAAQAGAEVVKEPLPGYGRACWRGLQQIPADIRWILFCDGDGSDDLTGITRWLPLRQRYELFLSDRTATAAGRAAMTLVQRWGNWLATRLIWLGWGHRYRDLGPLRMVQRQALEQAAMADRGFGWTVELQVRAVELGLRIAELPGGYHPRRGGRSKISGTLRGAVQAGTIILTTIGKLYLRRLVARIGGQRATPSPKGERL